MVRAHEIQKLREAHGLASMEEDGAHREHVRETMAWLMKRHQKSRDYLTAYDRGEVEPPAKAQRVTE